MNTAAAVPKFAWKLHSSNIRFETLLIFGPILIGLVPKEAEFYGGSIGVYIIFFRFLLSGLFLG